MAANWLTLDMSVILCSERTSEIHLVEGSILQLGICTVSQRIMHFILAVLRSMFFYYHHDLLSSSALISDAPLWQSLLQLKDPRNSGVPFVPALECGWTVLGGEVVYSSIHYWGNSLATGAESPQAYVLPLLLTLT